MHRFRLVPSLLAAVSLVAASPAHGRAETSATLADFRIELTDLDPSDGMAPSLTLDPQAYSSAEVMAASDVESHGSHGDSAFGAVSTSREIDGSGGAASFSGDPFGAGAVIAASAFADHGEGASSFAAVEGPPSALSFGDFVLGPRSQVTFSGKATVDWSVSDTRTTTYAALNMAFMRLVDGQQHWTAPVDVGVSYFSGDPMSGTLSEPMELSFANTSDAAELVIFSLGVDAFAIDAQLDPSPVDEPAGAALWLAGASLLLWGARRCRR